MQDSESSGSLDMSNLRASFVDALAPGWETATTGLLWIFFTLAQHPDTQHKIRQEITDVTNDCRPPAYGDRHLMPFTEAAITECMRLKPTAPFNTPHIASSDCAIGGYDVPRGSAVIANTWYLGLTPNLWDNSDQFNPDRFLDEGGKFNRRPELILFGYGNLLHETFNNTGYLYSAAASKYSITALTICEQKEIQAKL